MYVRYCGLLKTKFMNGCFTYKFSTSFDCAAMSILINSWGAEKDFIL